MHAVLRHSAALVVAVLGTFGVFGLSIGMNSQVEAAITEPVSVIEELAVAPKSKPAGPSRQKRPAPAKKAARAAPSASPLLSASLAGLSFGLEGGASDALGQATEALIGEMGGAAMDASDVEVAPVPTERVQPAYPARARSQGATGYVTLSFVVDVDGSVQDIAVAESDPPGIFDDAAVQAVSQWTFQPGEQAGTPVPVRVRQTLRFELD